MLTVFLAEFEREFIRARTSEGGSRAKARVVKLGRKPNLTDDQKNEAIRRQRLGNACGNWPRLKCERLDDCAALASVRSQELLEKFLPIIQNA